VSAEAWVEWKECCAAELCSKETQDYLYEFGRKRFHSICRKRWSGDMKIKLSDAPSAEWGLLESHAVFTRSGAWKRYKDRMFETAEADGFEKGLEGYAFKMLATAITALAKKELPSWKSGDEPVGDGSSGATRIDFFFCGEDGPSESVYAQEVAEIAADMAKDIALEPREEVFLVAMELGLGLNDANVLRALGMPKSTVYDHRTRFISRIGKLVTEEFAGQDDDDETRRDVTLGILDELKKRTFSKFVSERRHPELFMKAEGSDPS